MIAVDHQGPWLTAVLSAPCRVLSWAPHRPGYQDAGRVVWREVRDADLTPDFDALHWFAGEMAAFGAADSVGFLTSRDVARYDLVQATVDGITAHCVATVGLSNAERVGSRVQSAPAPIGTINLLVAVDQGLTDTGLLEMLSIATQARTVAVMEGGPILPQGRATGTGTDCIAVAAPRGQTVFAGLHTALGEAVGQAVHAAVGAGVARWMKEMDHG